MHKQKQDDLGLCEAGHRLDFRVSHDTVQELSNRPVLCFAIQKDHSACFE